MLSVVRVSAPAASGVLVGVSIRCRVLVTICGLTHRGAVAVLSRCAVCRAAVGRVNLPGGSVGICLMLAVCGVSVLRNRRGSVTSIGIGTLNSRGRRSRSRVVRLSRAYGAVSVRCGCAARIGPGRRVIASACRSRTVWAVSRSTGTVIPAVPRSIPVIRAP